MINPYRQGPYRHTNVIMRLVVLIVTCKDCSIPFYFLQKLVQATTKKDQNSILITLCNGNPPLTGGFPINRSCKCKKRFHFMASSWWITWLPPHPNGPKADHKAGWESEYVPLRIGQTKRFALLHKISRTAGCFVTRTLKQYRCYQSATIPYWPSIFSGIQRDNQQSARHTFYLLPVRSYVVLHNTVDLVKKYHDVEKVFPVFFSLNVNFTR